VALDHLSEGRCEVPGMGYPLRVLTVQVPGGPDLLWGAPPLSGELIQCHNYHSDYACLHGEVVVPGSVRMDFSTRVPITRCVWALVVTSCLVRY
jgi:hypothetical protein